MRFRRDCSILSTGPKYPARFFDKGARGLVLGIQPHFLHDIYVLVDGKCSWVCSKDVAPVS